MKLIYLILLFFSCAPVSQDLEVPVTEAFSDRNFIIKFPKTYEPSKSYGLIFGFHGAYGNGDGMQRTSKLEAYSENYIVVYPNSKVENWEEGCKCNKPYRLGIDDVGFISRLIDELLEKYTIDQTKIFAVGFSQGGLFVHNLACKLSGKFNGIASVASPMSVPLSTDCSPRSQVSVLMIHGVNDGTLPYLGSNQGSFSLLSSPEAIRFWAKKNALIATPKTEFIDSKKNIKRDHFSGSNKTKAVLYSIEGGGHSWNYTGLNSSQTIIDFFDSLSE